MDISNFIEQLMAKGYTQVEIAEMTGLKQAFISQLKSGGTPSLKTVIAFADTFGVTVDEVLGRTPPELHEPPAPRKRKPKTNSYNGHL